MKIFKLFISLSLILSISLLNSFAAISVSDGSAFVTKAEFAADLNNLSNRMSSLENSLDAKIDSLVSSYLSRNGIWNGVKQEKLLDKINIGSSIKFADDFNDKFYPLKLNQKLGTINKTGLLRLKISSEKRLYMVSNVTSSTGSVGLLSIVFFFTSNSIKNISVGNWYSAATNSSNLFNDCLSTWRLADAIKDLAFMIGRPAFTEYIYFFVDKDSDLYCSVIAMGSIRGQAVGGVTSSWATNAATELDYELIVY